MESVNLGSGFIGSIVTVISFITFVGVVLWAWNSKRKEEFDVAANLPFADEGKQPNSLPPGQ